MKIKYVFLTGLLALFCVVTLLAQGNRKDNLVQFSGLVLDGSDEQLVPVPYANIIVKDRNRGTYTDLRGFFSIVVEKGDIIQFSAVGYKTIEYPVPADLEGDRKSIVQLMTQDTFNLPETVVFPWPSREHFRLEFLAMDVTPELQSRAQENLAEEVLEKQRNIVSYDGNESADFYLRQQARRSYSFGQTPPMNIFNPIAWKQFFDSWKKGDFKRKDNN